MGIETLMPDARLTVVGERHLGMTLENGTLELEPIAKAFQAISKEISYAGLAKTLLNTALGYSGAVREGRCLDILRRSARSVMDRQGACRGTQEAKKTPQMMHVV